MIFYCKEVKSHVRAGRAEKSQTEAVTDEQLAHSTWLAMVHPLGLVVIWVGWESDINPCLISS